MFRTSPTSSSSAPRSSTPELEMELPGRASTRTSTSLWSDDATEVPFALPLPLPNHNSGAKEGRLIDYDPPSDFEAEVAPGDKLRELLRAMQQEVEVTKPVPVSAPAPGRNWRRSMGVRDRDLAGGREELAGPSSRDSSPERRYTDNQDDEEEQSPPTPPPRITNPYAARRAERKGSPSFSQPGRLPSRAAVLRNSISRSPETMPEPQEPAVRSPPTRLEAFLASNPTIPPPAAEASTSRHDLSRSDFDSASSSSSRKGKARASTPQPEQSSSFSRRSRVRRSPVSPEDGRARTQLPPTTPRRVSVDLAPDDMASFARNVRGLEVRAEVDLDLDEGFSALGWSETSGSVAEHSEGYAPEPSVRRSISLDDREESSRERSTTARPRQRDVSRSPSPPRPKSRETSLRSSTSRRTSDPNSRYLSAALDDSISPPLPALPEPDISARSDTSELDTYSSRRAALFRSTSEVPSNSTSRSTSRLRYERGGSQTPSASYRTDLGSKSRISRTSFEREHSRADEEGDVANVDEDSPVIKDRILPRRSPQSRVSPTTTPPRIETESRQARRSPRQSPQVPSPSVQADSSGRSPLVKSSPPGHSSYVEAYDIPAQPPVRVGMALTPPSHLTVPELEVESTPARQSRADQSIGIAPTPKPPGAWQSTPKGRVRFTPSPLGKGSGSPTRAPYSPLSSTSGQGQDVSVLRLRLSPRRARKEKENEKEGTPDGKGKGMGDDEEGESSFIGRLKESLTGSLSKTRGRIPIPGPSTTFTLAAPTLETAQAKSASTASQLHLTQRQWLEALSTLNSLSASASAKHSGVADGGFGSKVRTGWGWGTWAWWILVEVVVLWSVFRVTLDYATSVTHLTSFDPFHPLALPYRPAPVAPQDRWGTGPFASPLYLIPVPSALQSIVGRGSANFFDLLEGWELWRRFVGGQAMALGGVPS